jgi:KipI family sensor histidine kinase inhibitor
MEGVRTSESAGRLWQLPVCYDCELAPDLGDVAARTGLTCAAVVERHAAVVYHVYMLGFLPGLAYLGDVPSELALPRREVPRTRIPAGSVAIAMSMSCIFPRETPCGIASHRPLAGCAVAPVDGRRIRRAAGARRPGDLRADISS